MLGSALWQKLYPIDRVYIASERSEQAPFAGFAPLRETSEKKAAGLSVGGRLKSGRSSRGAQTLDIRGLLLLRRQEHRCAVAVHQQKDWFILPGVANRLTELLSIRHWPMIHLLDYIATL